MASLVSILWLLAIITIIVTAVGNLYYARKNYLRQIDFLKYTEDSAIKAYSEATELITAATEAIRAIESAHGESESERGGVENEID